jgi:hypothetical protein
MQRRAGRIAALSGALDSSVVGRSCMAMRAARALIWATLGVAVASLAWAENDYPTEARAEFVFACMATNGQTQQALRRCSCAIDVIASVLPYNRFVDAETVLRMRRGVGGGYLAQTFRSAKSNEIVRELEEVQAEAEVRCF